MEDQFIKPSNHLIKRQLITYGVCIVLCVMVYLFQDTLTDNELDKAYINKATFWVIVMLVLLSLINIRILWGKDKQLHLTQYGIKNEVYQNNSEYLGWVDVKSVLTKELYGKTYLLIMLHRPEYYMQQAKRGVQALLAHNNEYFGTPIAIQIDKMKRSPAEIQALVEQYLKESL